MRNHTLRLLGVVNVVLAVGLLVGGGVFAREKGPTESLDFTLLKASDQGDVAAVRATIDRGASPGCRDDYYGGSPLHWAAYKGHLQTVEVLLNRGADINARNKEGRTPLILAAAMNQLPVVKILLDRGADSGPKGNDGRTAMDWAERKHRSQVVQLFRSHLAKTQGPGPSAMDVPSVLTPTEKPAEGKHPDIKQSLQPKSREIIGAAQKGDAKELVRLLAEGADPNTKDKKLFRTALMWASSKGRPEAVKELLASGADVNAMSERRGTTALGLAVSNGHVEVVRLLLDSGANPDAGETARGQTPLMAASERGLTPIAALLIQKGADVNASGPLGCTAMMLACRKGRAEIADLLLDAQADLDVRDNLGRTAAEWAGAYGNKELRELILKRRALAERLQTDDGQAAEQGISEQVLSSASRESSTAAATPVAQPEDRNKALIDASAKGDLGEVQRLIAAGADLNSRNKVGATPLIEASAAGHMPVVQVLLDKGSDANAKTTDRMLAQTSVPSGMTALMLAAAYGHVEVVELLLDRGADINAGNDAGTTALFSAVDADRLAAVELLLKRGADVNTKSKTGETALDLASSLGLSDIAQILTQHGATASDQRKEEEGKTSASAGIKPPSQDKKPSDAPDAAMKPENREKAFWEAVARGDMKEVTRLLDEGAKVNVRDSSDCTPLMAACRKGNLEVVKLLVQRGADVNAEDKERRTALTYAAENSHSEVWKLLKQSGGKGAEFAQTTRGKARPDQPAGKRRVGAVAPGKNEAGQGSK